MRVDAGRRSGAIRLGIDGRELVGGLRTGIGRYLTEVIRAAVEDEWECVLYTDRAVRLDPALGPVTGTVLRHRWVPWWDQVGLPRQLARDRISVFLSPYYKIPVIAPCPAVATVHDLFFIGYLGGWRPVHDTVVSLAARVYTRRAAAIITDSESSRQTIIRMLGVRAERVFAIPLAVGPAFRPTPLTDAVRAQYGIRRPYVLCVGNFRPHKNLPRLLRAFAALPPSLGAYYLVLAGDGGDERSRLLALAEELGIAERVAFPGHVDEAHLAGLYSQSALFVLPSLEEGFGLPALEAMACGAPVVASNRGAIPEVVGAAAALVPADDHAAMADAMRRVLSAADVREDLKRRGLERARDFSPARTSRRVLALLCEVSERG